MLGDMLGVDAERAQEWHGVAALERSLTASSPPPPRAFAALAACRRQRCELYTAQLLVAAYALEPALHHVQAFLSRAALESTLPDVVEQARVWLVGGIHRVVERHACDVRLLAGSLAATRTAIGRDRPLSG